MTNRKTTKRALLSSILALVLCFAMLLGTTFAWFTDTATTNVNTIQAGTLDVALEMKDAQGNWVSAEGQTLNFIKAEGHENEAVLFEPGVTYNLPAIKVVNKGNLALKYKVVISAAEGDQKLAEVLDVYTNGTTTNTTLANALTSTDPDGYAHGNLVANTASDEITIALHMQESAGNEYQGLSLSGIAVTVYATQDTVEWDSVTNQYDANADYGEPWDGTGADSTEVPAADAEDGKIHISTAQQLVALMNTTTAYGADKVIVLDNSINLGGQTVKGIGADDAAFAATFDGLGYVISNFKIEQNRGYYAGLFSQVREGAVVKNLTVANATIEGTGTRMVGAVVAGTDGATIDNCKAINCTVTGLKKVGAVVGYAYAATVTNCFAKDCVVSTTSTDTAKQNEIGEVLGYENASCTVSGNSFENVTLLEGVSGATVVAPGVTYADDTYFISSVAGLNWFNDQCNKERKSFNGQTIKLMSDIDMKNANWLPAGQNDATMYDGIDASYNTKDFYGTFDGNGKTISNINIKGLSDTQVAALNTTEPNGGQQQVYSVGFIGYASSATIKNLTLKNVKVDGSHYVGAIVGMTDINSVITGCTVDYATISCKHITDAQCGDKAGGIVGNLSGNTTITNCTVTNSTITAGRDAGQVVGCAQVGSTVGTGNTATNVTVTAGGDCTGANINSTIIGRDCK